MKPKLQKEILDAMSKNPAYWKGIFYINRKDPRLIVPKLDPWLGWTINFASPYSWLLVISLLIIILLHLFGVKVF